MNHLTVYSLKIKIVSLVTTHNLDSSTLQAKLMVGTHFAIQETNSKIHNTLIFVTDC